MNSYYDFFSQIHKKDFDIKLLKENNFNIKINDNSIYNRKYFINFVAYIQLKQDINLYSPLKKHFYIGIFISRNTNNYYNLILECKKENIEKLYYLIENYLKSFNETNILDSLKYDNLTSDIKKLSDLIIN